MTSTSGYPKPMVTAAFGSTLGTNYLILGDTARGLLGTGVLAPQNTGEDISEYVIGFTSRRGAARPFEPVSAGTATVRLADQNDDFNPRNLAGRFVSAGVTQVRPMVLVRIRVEYPQGSGTVYSINAVYAERWDPAYTRREAFATMVGADAFKALNLNVPSGPSAAAGAGETTGARIGRRLDDHGWASLDRDLDTGKSTVAATTRSTAPLEEMQAAETAEAGYLDMDAQNRVRFRDRHSRFEDTVSLTVQATFGDDVDAGELHYDSIEIANDDGQILNTVTGSIEGGTPQTSTDSASVGKYFPRTDTATGLLLQSDTDAARWAEFRLGRYTDFDTRIDSLTFELVPGDYRFPTLLGLDRGYRIAVKKRTPKGLTYTFALFVESIEWSASEDRWSCTIETSSAQKFSGFILGTSLLGSTTDLLVGW
ncbi:MAG: hypothetical protein FJW95_08185 [Actinobacteria bacterium]|nr:hypothetical protein [Actinomycetota bacterium]